MANDFHRVEFGSPRPARSPEPVEPAPRTVEPATPDPAPEPTGGVLVPLDQWNRILGQLGNIHEAGQQLADARERMARAETENEFLRERIRHLRSQVEGEVGPGAREAAEEPPPASTADPVEPARRRRKLQVEVGLPAWMTRRRRSTS